MKKIMCVLLALVMMAGFCVIANSSAYTPLELDVPVSLGVTATGGNANITYRSFTPPNTGWYTIEAASQKPTLVTFQSPVRESVKP